MSKNHSAASRGYYLNSGNGPTMQPIDIGHSEYVGLLDPDTAFWSLIKKEKLGDAITDGKLLKKYNEKSKIFEQEMETLRFGLKTSAVYFNLTDRCNLNCDYCYIPEGMRKNGKDMSEEKVTEALTKLKEYFNKVLPKGTIPQIIFHGAEPMLNKKALFGAIEKFKNDFYFGVQTNGSLLDEESLDFLKSHEIGIGLSLDGHTLKIADGARKNWAGEGVSKKVIKVLESLKGYPHYNVICTVTKNNMPFLTNIVEYFHSLEVSACMLNPVRCTRQGVLDMKPLDHDMVKYYFDALDRTYSLYKETGRKLVVVNFSNILVSIVAPSARRLMCDISPCGGGRCFFAISADGDLFPCSEFIGLEAFKGGNIFKAGIKKALDSKPFQLVTNRKVENIAPCSSCAVRHFCGSPCPAEAFENNEKMESPGAFCELYEEQVRYALRLIADEKKDAYLWDEWDADTSSVLNITSF